jgi:hypothetical protein
MPVACLGANPEMVDIFLPYDVLQRGISRHHGMVVSRVPDSEASKSLHLSLPVPFQPLKPINIETPPAHAR